MKSSSDKNFRIFSTLLLTVSAGLFVYACISTFWGTLVKNYAIREVPNSAHLIQAPALPDISPYTADAIERLVPATSRGSIKVTAVSQSPIFNKMDFPRDDIKGILQSKQQTEHPVVIEIQSGVYTLDQVVGEVNNTNYLERTGSGYVLKIPLFVNDSATLILKGNGTERLTLKLAEESGAFISVFGRFFASYADITGWRLIQNQAARFNNKTNFRPFLIFWSNSESYITHSSLKNLGFSKSKMYGLSYSSDVFTRNSFSEIRTKAWLLDNLIEDLYYGFYSYEVNDVVLLRNDIKDSVVTGLDPHDRSARLVIGYNATHGTQKRHGILLSRSVNNSFVFNNHSYDNAGSGIMLDRNCSKNIIASNLVENNAGDGISFFESPHNSSFENTIKGNRKSGIRIRNSWNISITRDNILENYGYALLAYAMSLEKSTGEDRPRDLKSDPYVIRTSFDVTQASLSGNRTGNFNLMNVERASFNNLALFKAYSGYFEGDSGIEDLQSVIYEKATDRLKRVEVYQKNFTPVYSEFWRGQDSTK